MWSRGSIFSVRSMGVEVSCPRLNIQCGRGGGGGGVGHDIHNDCLFSAVP